MQVEGTDINVFIPVLTELSNLTDTGYAIVANAARSILIEQTIPTVEQRRQKLKVRGSRRCLSTRVCGGERVSHRTETHIYIGRRHSPCPTNRTPPHPQGALVEVMNAPTPQARASKIEEFLEENVRVGDLLLYFLVRFCWGLF